MPCSSNNFQHIKKILRTLVDNLVLQIPLKLQVDRIKIVRFLLLAQFKNELLRKTCLKLQSAYRLSEAFDAKGCNFENKIFLSARLHFIFEYLKYTLSKTKFKKINICKILHRYYPLIER